jgi:hypothetical protein
MWLLTGKKALWREFDQLAPSWPIFQYHFLSNISHYIFLEIKIGNCIGRQNAAPIFSCLWRFRTIGPRTCWFSGYLGLDVNAYTYGRPVASSLSAPDKAQNKHKHTSVPLLWYGSTIPGLKQCGIYKNKSLCVAIRSKRLRKIYILDRRDAYRR